MKITIILPVYGQSQWLEEALLSVINQDYENWELIIADDGLQEKTRSWLKSWIKQMNKEKISIIQRRHNLGLFANLNRAIEEADTDIVLLLCSDDKLKKNAVSTLLMLENNWGPINLVLSSFESINADGTLRPDESGRHHEEIRSDTGLVRPSEMIPALLRLGSLNGNLTGMAFSKSFWIETGSFKEDWRHAADWEWLIRACSKRSVLINRNPIATVRTHGKQLSVRNRMSGHECREVAEVVGVLLEHPMLQSNPERDKWAGHVMQFQLWNLAKAALRGNWDHLSEGLRSIHKSAGIRQTVWSLLTWLPARWKKRQERRQQ